MLIIGCGLIWFTGDSGQFVRKSNLRPIMDQVEQLSMRIYCRQAESREPISAVVDRSFDKVLLEIGLKREQISSGRELLYIRKRFKRMELNIPPRCVRTVETSTNTRDS